ncbi:MAG: GAF domain-containing protein [Ardenticatenaceae bacterium]|nr:GAF domain-containing protein [Anaerolineales bacterium]MCB8923511.1 GAF domain-containing protein [Ardenticatenaceae bacterium]MCB9003764.1 GAF domain-containing protein [Ardenticatenaceae bacterium]
MFGLLRHSPENAETQQQSRLLQILAVTLAALTILYTLLQSPQPEYVAVPIILSLLLTGITIYLTRLSRHRLAVHFFFVSQTIIHVFLLFSSGVTAVAYLSLTAVVAVAILDSILASALYGTAVLISTTLYTHYVGETDASFLTGYYITTISLAIITWLIVRNIQETLRHAQEKTQTTQDNLSELQANSTFIQRRARQLQQSAMIGQVMNTIHDLEWLLKTSSELIHEQFGFYFVAIYLLDENANQLILKTATGQVGQIMQTEKFSVSLQANAIICTVANSRKARIAHDVSQDPAYLAVPHLAATQSEVAVPLIVRDTLLGILDVQSDEPNAFQEEDVNFLQILANQIAGSIDNARLFAETETQLNEAVTLYNLNTLLTTTLDAHEIYRRSALAFIESINCSRCIIYSWEPELNTITVQIDFTHSEKGQTTGHFNFNRTVYELQGMSDTQRVLQTLETLTYHRQDHGLPTEKERLMREAGLDISLVLPMIQGIEAIGLIELFRTEAQGNFNQRESELAQTMANQIASARQNAMLATEARARAAQLSTLNRISTVLSLSPSLTDVFDGARREIMSLIEATGMSIILLNSGGTHLNWIYGYERGQEVDLSSIPLLPISQGFSGYVVRNRDVLHINRQMQEMSNELQSLTVGALPNSWLGLPLFVTNELIGVLAVENEFDNEAFSEQDVALLKTIAGPLAITIKNSLQFAEIQAALEAQSKQRVQLQTAAEVAAAASTILDGQVLINRAVTLIKERFGLYYVGLFLIDESGKQAVLRAGTDEAGRVQLAQGHQLTVGGRSLIGGATSDGRIRITQNVTEDTEWLPNPTLPDTRAELALPLRVRDEIIGALTVQSAQANAFDEGLIGTLQTMSDQLAVAIENAQLLAGAEARNRQQRLLNEISARMYQSVDVTEIVRVGLQAISDQLGGAEVGAQLGMEAPDILNNDVWRSSQIAFQAGYTPDGFRFNRVEKDVEMGNGRSLPLQLGETPFGLISLPQDVPIDAEKETFIQNLIREMGNALNNAFLLQTTRVHANQLALATEVSRAATTILDRSHLIQEVVNLIRSRYTLYYVGLFLLDESGQTAVLQAGTGEAGKLQLERRHRLIIGGPSMIGTAISQGKAIVEQDVTQAAAFTYNPLLPETRAELALPLRTRGRVMGAITVQSAERYAFTDDTVAVLQNLADQLAIAIETATLFAQIQDTLAETSHLYETGQEMSTAVSPHAVYRALINFTSQADIVDTAQILILDPDDDDFLLCPALWTREPLKEKALVRYPRQSYKFGEQLLHGVLLLLDDTMTDSRLDETTRTWFVRNQMRSCALIPLAVEDTWLGTLVLHNRQKQAFDEDTLRPFLTLADQAAVILANQRLLREVQAANEQLRQLDKLKTQFLANMSHELRTPLNSIIGFSRVILKGIDGPISVEQEEDLTSIYNNGQHLLRLINEILDMAKIEAGKMILAFESVDLAEIAQAALDTIRSLAHEKGLTLHAAIPDQLPQIEADPVRLRQILNNLLSNAVKYTDEGNILLHIQPNGATHIHITVSDTGIGISQEDFDKLFAAFEQVDNSTTRMVGGTGLGLPITKWLVNMHQGTITVESEIGRGSTFHVRLPVHQDETLTSNITFTESLQGSL